MTNPEELEDLERVCDELTAGRFNALDGHKIDKWLRQYLSILPLVSEMVGAMKDAEAELAWLKQTAEDTRDNCRIVGYEDCLRGFRNNTTAIAKILGG